MTVIILHDGALYADRVSVQNNFGYISKCSKLTKNGDFFWGAAGCASNPAMFAAGSLAELASAIAADGELRWTQEVIAYDPVSKRYYHGAGQHDEKSGTYAFLWCLADDGLAIGSYSLEWGPQRFKVDPVKYIRRVHALWGLDSVSACRVSPVGPVETDALNA